MAPHSKECGTRLTLGLWGFDARTALIVYIVRIDEIQHSILAKRENVARLDIRFRNISLRASTVVKWRDASFRFNKHSPAAGA